MTSKTGKLVTHNGEPSFRQARAAINKYMKDIENDGAARRLRTTLVEERIAKNETSSNERFKELKESLAELDEKSVNSHKDWRNHSRPRNERTTIKPSEWRTIWWRLG